TVPRTRMTAPSALPVTGGAGLAGAWASADPTIVTASSRLIDTGIIHVFMPSPLASWTGRLSAKRRRAHTFEVARASVAPNGTKVLQAPDAGCATLADRLRHGPTPCFALSGQYACVSARAWARAPAPGHARRHFRSVARPG